MYHYKEEAAASKYFEDESNDIYKDSMKDRKADSSRSPSEPACTRPGGEGSQEQDLRSRSRSRPPDRGDRRRERSSRFHRRRERLTRFHRS